MFVRYFAELALPFERVEPELLREPAEWIPGAVRQAEDRRDRLLAAVGFGEAVRVDKRVEVSFGQPLRTASRTVLPMKWEATGVTPLFPTLDADIEVAPLGPERTQLAISARYVPPLGAVGRAIDRALLHRVAEATVKDFLDRAAHSLSKRVAAAH